MWSKINSTSMNEVTETKYVRFSVFFMRNDDLGGLLCHVYISVDKTKDWLGSEFTAIGFPGIITLGVDLKLIDIVGFSLVPST